jgi:hypothetical protein
LAPKEISPEEKSGHTKNEGHITANEYNVEKEKNKAIPVPGLGGLLSHETSRLPHFVDNRFVVGG